MLFRSLLLHVIISHKLISFYIHISHCNYTFVKSYVIYKLMPYVFSLRPLFVVLTAIHVLQITNTVLHELWGGENYMFVQCLIGQELPTFLFFFLPSVARRMRWNICFLVRADCNECLETAVSPTQGRGHCIPFHIWADARPPKWFPC